MECQLLVKIRRDLVSVRLCWRGMAECGHVIHRVFLYHLFIKISNRIVELNEHV